MKRYGVTRKRDLGLYSDGHSIGDDRPRKRRERQAAKRDIRRITIEMEEDRNDEQELAQGN